MTCLPDTNACIALLRQRNPELVSNTPEFSRIPGLKLRRK